MEIQHILLPCFLISAVACFFLSLPDLKNCALTGAAGNPGTSREGIMPREDGKQHSLTLKDWLLVLIISGIYAFTAFNNLGNTASPQSFCFLEAGEEYVIETGGAEPVSCLAVFPVINTGEVAVYVSEDGIEYFEAGILQQDYVSLLKWNNVQLSGPGFNVAYIKLVPSARLGIAEAALYSAAGNRIPLYSAQAELCDEPELASRHADLMNSAYFDEIYHVRTAVEHINGIEPYEISHPPLGKILISLGIRLFGMTPFGWRFSGTFLGVLMLPIIYIFLKVLFGSYSVPACGTALLASGFMHFAQTRLATIDTYAVFFILLMYLFMYLFLSREKLVWLALSGISFGLGAASKWTCLYAGAGLGVMWVLYWAFSRRSFKSFIRNVLFCLLFFVLIPAAVYYISYYPYGAARGLHGIRALFSREYFDIVISNQTYMFNYHSGLVAEHPYSSTWLQWIFDIRPILYYLEYFDNGKVSSISAFTNPAVCWGGFISLFVLLYAALFRKDNRAGFILLGYLAQLLPWVFVPRLTFAYHYFPCTVFLCLSIAYSFNILRLDGSRFARIPMYGFTVLSVLLFILFFPVISGSPVSAEFSDVFLGWFKTWPF